MSSLSLAVGNCGKGRNAENLSSEFVPHSSLGSEFLTKRLYGLNLKDLGSPKVRTRKKFRIAAEIKKWKKQDYPWHGDIDPDTKTPLKYLSYFKPLDEKPKPVTLAFEKPLVNLEKQLIEVRRMAEDTGLDFTDQIYALEAKYQQALRDLYTHLTPIQRLQIARHPNRPTVLDHILNMTEKWVELHGDRAGYDDPAMVTGIGSIEGRSYLFIGHQKGRNTKENIMRNFAMPTPHGYRKALRMMKYADHHGFPIVTFVDTPGAFADLRSEELGQGEAIAYNLRAMFGLKVPIITVVTGEGGSGGALAIGCANKLLMLENSAFYVASPEACAAILWKSSQAAPKAAEKLRITAQEHYRLRIADGIIPEPLGGAHADPFWASQQIKHAILDAMAELGRMNSEQLLHQRMLKFRSIGGFQEGIQVEPERKRNMKLSEANTPPADLESELANLKKKILEAKGPSDPVTIQVLEKLQEDLDTEMTKAFIAMGLDDKIKSLKLELQRAPILDQPLNKSLQEKADKIMQEFKQKLSQPGAYLGLKQKLYTVNMASRLIELKNKSEKIKNEVNQKIPTTVKAKIDRLNAAINALVKKKEVALTSKKPGKTQLINHFLVNKSWYIVDLPGYGFANASEAARMDWSSFTKGYFLNRDTLVSVLLLIDASVPPQKIDLDCANWLGRNKIPITFVFTKCDKMKGGKAKRPDQNIRDFQELIRQNYNHQPPWIMTSSVSGLGRDELLLHMSQLRNYWNNE